MLFLVSIAMASGMFFELPAEERASSTQKGESDEDFIGGLKQYFGYEAEPDSPSNSSLNKTAQNTAAASESSGFYDDVDSALEEATDTVDGLWQQFKKGLFSLMGSFSIGDDGDDGPATPTPALPATKPIANETSVVTEPTPAVVASSNTTTGTTRAPAVGITAATAAVTQNATAVEATTKGTASTVETTTVIPAPAP
ncbi:hypothetical protein KR018_011515 [Drosophila ironensis]|nr:hypothetical protein KR018_011515 [Drosophila ironensis]